MSRKKVTVVGSGFVGSTTAQRIVDMELADVILTDILDGPPAGKALDMVEATPITKSDAFAFNAELPCRADLIRLTGGGHSHHVLATFRLRKGPGGPCSGLTRVRYTIREGKFTAWRQLAEPEGPEV